MIRFHTPRVIAISGIALFALIAFSCKKDDVTPVGAQSNGILLAGNKGSSKTWQLTAFTGAVGGGTPQNLSVDACVLDNNFVFSNNDLQRFEHSEGSTKCDAADSTIVEDGSWAFTLDGKKLLVDGTGYSGQYLFTSIGRPVDIITLTDVSMKVGFSIAFNGTTYNYTMTFTKK